MKPQKNNMDGTPGLLGAAAFASAFGKGLQTSERHVTHTIPEQLARQSGFDHIRTFHAYFASVVIVLAIGAGLVVGIVEDSLPVWVDESAPLWVWFLFLVPTVMLVGLFPIAAKHVSAKMKARVYNPLDEAWRNSGTAGNALVAFIQVVAYTLVMVPIFLLQDLIEWARVLLSGGKHKFRTSEHRYFDKQRVHYNVLRGSHSLQLAEDFLMKSSATMHVNGDMPLSLNHWLKGGYRKAVIGALESKYGPLVPGESAATGPMAAQKAAPARNAKSRSEVDSIVVKPVKGLR